MRFNTIFITCLFCYCPVCIISILLYCPVCIILLLSCLYPIYYTTTVWIMPIIQPSCLNYVYSTTLLSVFCLFYYCPVCILSILLLSCLYFVYSTTVLSVFCLFYYCPFCIILLLSCLYHIYYTLGLKLKLELELLSVLCLLNNRLVCILSILPQSCLHYSAAVLSECCLFCCLPCKLNGVGRRIKPV